VGTDHIVAGLDDRQREAVVTDASPLAIIASAGSGKTRVLTRRIAYRIGNGSADPRHVLVLTFTRDAAGELRRRLRRLDISERIESGTFHSVALRLLRDRAAAAGTTAPAVAPDRMRLAREVLTETRIAVEPAAALADLDWARARMVAPSDVAGASRMAKRRLALTPEQHVRFAERYTALKRRRGVLDFDDLLEGLLDAMRRDATFTDIVRWRFRHLFVDEAQDLNPLQFALLEHIRGERADICLVGDPRQAIYGWNGADPTLLDEVERHLPGVTIVRLQGNYRCTPQVVRAGAAALAPMGVADDTVSRRNDGRIPTVHSFADEQAEARWVADSVRPLMVRHGARQVAVLARTNDQLAVLSRALARVGVPVLRTVGASPLERCVAEAVRTGGREQLAAWIDAVWASDDADPIRMRVAEEADRYLTSGDSGGLQSWLDARQPFEDLETDDGQPAVALLTFHAAKGREWGAVVVTGVEAGLVPHSSSGSTAQRAEESRLFHVALTRAADELVITSADTRGGKTTGPSPWLAAVNDALVAPTPTGPPPEQRRTTPVDPFDTLRAWRADVARAAGVADAAVCSTTVLRSLLERPPADAAALATRLGVGQAAAERLAPRLLAVLADLSRPDASARA
jgi:DNA helicase II / ATP-dependent DNA helicase PcrA